MVTSANQPHSPHLHQVDLVLVWYPPHDAAAEDRETWSWLPGMILAQAGSDEWHVILDVPSLSHPDPEIPNGDAPENRLYPTCFRDASERRAVSAQEWDETYRRWTNA